jgi:hypothetical protein
MRPGPEPQARPTRDKATDRNGYRLGFRVENLKHGWALFQPTSYVNWCGHAQEIISLPLADGRVTFVPVLGEAR